MGPHLAGLAEEKTAKNNQLQSGFCLKMPQVARSAARNQPKMQSAGPAAHVECRVPGSSYCAVGVQGGAP